MADHTLLAWDESVTGYDFGRDHPMDPVRLWLTMRLVEDFGLEHAPGVRVASAPPADERLLRLVHDRDYVEAVRRASASPRDADPAYGLGTEDDPAFAGMHEAAARIAGLSVAAAEAVWRGEAEHAVNFAGGLHHAMPGAAAGFCVYNDPAIAVARLLELGAERIAYLDLDVHHGDGVQRAFWDEPRVLTISVHESPRYLFPGTGFPEESGGPGAEGSAVNLALPPGTADSGWLRGIHSVVPPLLAAFRPQVLVSQHGADTHVDDPLAHLAISLDAQRVAAATAHRLAHEHAGGRWLALGGGGYEVVDVVPRAWTHLVAEAAEAPIAPETPVPAEWRERVRGRLSRPGPARMTDGRTPHWRDFGNGGYDPANPVDQAVLATRKTAFPALGLDPLFDL